MPKPRKRFRFREFAVYKDSISLSLRVRTVSRTTFPPDERFGLTSQISRAADSVALNIAEGSERGTDKDFAHFLNLASSSLNEVAACLDLTKAKGHLSESQLSKPLSEAEKMANQLSAFRQRVLRDVR